MQKIVIGSVIAAVIQYAIGANAVPTRSDAEQSMPTSQGLKKADRSIKESEFYVGSGIYALMNAYGVPVSFEYSFINSDRSNREYQTIDYSLSAGDSLATALDRLCENSGGRFVWKRIHGVLCVLPAESGEMKESTLDAMVSLHLDNASAWEAILALTKAVNDKQTDGRILRIRTTSSDQYQLFPLELKTAKTLSIHLDDVTAREALCAIISASDFELRYSYFNHYRPIRYPNSKPSSRVTIFGYEDGTLVHRPLTGEQLMKEQMEETREVEMTLPVGRRRPEFRQEN